MRDKKITRDFYINQLKFEEFGSADFDGYLMIQKDTIQIHFFEYKELNVLENYGQVYIRSNDIEQDYQLMLDDQVSLHPNGALQLKPWGKRNSLYSILIIIY